ncbi:MAG: sulfatase [Candidatus Aminicenantaceae bacterium]
MNRRKFIQTVGLGLTSIAVPGCRRSSEQISKPPNIIFLLTDDQRWDAIRCAGNSIIQTPNMDWLAESSVRFGQAFVTTPICAASRASIFCGLYERTHDYTFTKPPLARLYTDISYPLLLRQAGYRTGFIGKFGIRVEEGVTEEMFDSFQPTTYPYFKDVDGEKRHLTDIHGDLAVDFLQTASKDQPFCLSLSFWAPHADDGEEEQYFWPEAWDGFYDGVHIPVPETADPAFFDTHPEFLKKSLNRTRWLWRFDTPDKYQKMVKGYYRMISGVDAVIGRIIAELRNLEQHENTIIILSSDNGYFLGERGFAGKWLMHDVSIRVPLIIYDPRFPLSRKGSIREELALNIDTPATILDMAGLETPSTMEGTSLIPVLGRKVKEWRQEIFCEHLWDNAEIPQSECIRTLRWKYIRYPQHPDFEELYDLQSDPKEIHNLVSEAVYSSVLKELREKCDIGFRSKRK